jgi:probable selenium-dependent hydroxylase accessory protein YqeC
VGSLALHTDPKVLLRRLKDIIADGRIGAVGSRWDQAGKIVGVPPVTIDVLWRGDVADCVLVEADGCRGRSLKAFGLREPQVPPLTTTIVLVAGADVLGKPLREEYVQRAAPLAARIGVPLGSAMTPALVAAALRDQSWRLRRGWPAARLVVLVNKVEGDAVLAAATATAALLRAPLEDAAVPAPGVASGGDALTTAVPDRVVLASLEARRFSWSAHGAAA